VFVSVAFVTLGTGHRTLVPGYAPIYICVGPRHTIVVGVPSCPLRVRCNNVIDTMFSPNPAPSTAGSGFTRARTPHGGMSPTAPKRIVPHGDDHRGADGDRGRVTELPAFLPHPLLSSLLPFVECVRVGWRHGTRCNLGTHCSLGRPFMPAFSTALAS
jgi:hypothetical protein